MVTLNFDLVT